METSATSKGHVNAPAQSKSNLNNKQFLKELQSYHIYKREGEHKHIHYNNVNGNQTYSNTSNSLYSNEQILHMVRQVRNK